MSTTSSAWLMMRAPRVASLRARRCLKELRSLNQSVDVSQLWGGEEALPNIVCNRPYKANDLTVENQQCGSLENQEADDEIVVKLQNQTGLLDFNTHKYDLYRVKYDGGETQYHARLKGCICDTAQYYGEYCDMIDLSYDAWATRSAYFHIAGHAAAVALACAALLFWSAEP